MINTLSNARKWDKALASRFTYTHDKIENWRSHAKEFLADDTYHVFDDCDGLASTVLELLYLSGVPADKLWRVAVKSPQAEAKDYIDHMVGMIELDNGRRYIVGDTFSEGKPVPLNKTVHDLVETSSLAEGIIWRTVPNKKNVSLGSRPKNFIFGARSRKNRDECHPAMIEIANLALKKTTVDFGIIDGARTDAEQREHLEKGSSTTLNSRHLKRWCHWKGRRYKRSHAVDVMAYVGSRGVWKPESLYHEIAKAFKEAANELGYEIEWGGDWGWDFGHFQLSWSMFPVEK